ncbi:hypothetical protein QTP88_025147 [Uroleucon formosanum]
MRKEQCFIFATLIIGMITSLPHNDSTVPVRQIKLTTSNLEFASTKPEDKITIKEKGNVTTSKFTAQVSCGKRMALNFRILGGSESQLGAWPWMVALGYKNSQKINDSIEWRCGGTLISNEHVLTSSTCVANTGLNILTVARLGELNLDPMVNDGALPLDVPIKRIINHEGYDSKKIINNLAILVLKNSVTFNELIQPICLPLLLDMNKVEKSKNIPFVVGWGSINTAPQKNEKISKSLMEVRIPISNITECKQTYSNYKSVIDDRVLCAGYPEGGKDSCRGDSGGPLMWSKRNQFYLIGVVSYGFNECGDPGHPGVYTKVTSYTDWILDGIND